MLISFGEMRGPLDEREPVHIDDAIERRYVVRRVKQRIHQAQFRGAVLPAYRDRCAICTLKEIRLLDAAHIVGDADEQGEPLVSNGLSLCSIHHRAFDEDLVGISSDYNVHVSPRLLDPTVGEIASPGVTMEERSSWLRVVMAAQWADLDESLQSWRESLLAALVALPTDTVVVTHFVAINTVVGACTGDERVLSFSPAHTSITEVEVVGGALRLVARGAEANTSVR